MSDEIEQRLADLEESYRGLFHDTSELEKKVNILKLENNNLKILLEEIAEVAGERFDKIEGFLVI